MVLSETYHNIIGTIQGFACNASTYIWVIKYWLFTISDISTSKNHVFNGWLFWGREGVNISDKTVINNLICYEKYVINWMYRGKYENIKEGQEVKYTKKIVKSVESINKDIPLPMQI